MIELTLLLGYCTIQLVKKVGGSTLWPYTLRWEVVGNTLVDEVKFQPLNQHTWLMVWDSHTRSYRAFRTEKRKGKRIYFFMAREILGLPRNPGHGCDVADHRNHDTLDNTTENLRVATQIQNQVNGVKRGYCERFKGISKSQRGKNWQSKIRLNGTLIYFPSVPEVEAALVYNYAAYLIYGEHTHLNVISDNEMPTCDRQWDLYDVVVAKLRAKGFPCVDAVTREE